MKIRRTRRFKKNYQTLPQRIQRRVDDKLQFLLRDPRHPSLRIHKVRGVEGLWELSVTMDYRILFEIEEGLYVLLAVGPHQIVDRWS
jgi:addiction module RelE/StbE family toxin